MHFNIVLAIVRKDLLSMIKSKNILIIILTPVLLSILSVSISSLALDPTVSVAVYDKGSNTDFLEYLTSVDNYNIIVVNSAEQFEDLFYKENVAALMIIPDGFSADLKKGSRPALAITLNPSNKNSITFLQTYKDIIMEFTKQEYPVRVSLKTIPTSMQSQFNIPIWIMFTLIFVGISVLPNTLTTEKEKKTLDAILVSPASEKDVIYGKSLFGLALTILISLIIIVINKGFTGNIFFVLLFIFLGSAAFTGLGLLISSYADSYSSASIISTVFMIPLILLALLADTSKGIWYISHLVPSIYVLDGIKDAMFNNAGIRELYPELGALLLFNILIYTLTARVLNSKRW